MKIKRYILSSAILAVVFFSFQSSDTKIEYFEGTVTYQTDLFLHGRFRDSSIVRGVNKNKSTLVFSEGNRLVQYEEGLKKQELYRRNDNKVYSSLNKNDTAFFTECNKASDDSVRFKLVLNKETILGVECDELTIYYKDRTVTDYFNSQLLAIDPEWYKDCKLNSQSLIAEKEQGLCLKQKIEYPSYTITSTATSFTKMKVDQKLFDLPKAAILKKANLNVLPDRK